MTEPALYLDGQDLNAIKDLLQYLNESFKPSDGVLDVTVQVNDANTDVMGSIMLSDGGDYVFYPGIKAHT